MNEKRRRILLLDVFLLFIFFYGFVCPFLALAFDSIETKDDYDFSNWYLFVLTTIGTIGFGRVVPKTRGGKILVVVMALILIPLVMITLSKCSELLYSTFVEKPLRFCMASQSEIEIDTELKMIEAEIEALQINAGILERRLNRTRFRKLKIFFLIFGWTFLYLVLGIMVYRWQEGWSYFNASYYTLTSWMTIGFGDFVPCLDHDDEHDYTIYFFFHSIYCAVGLSMMTSFLHAIFRYEQRHSPSLAKWFCIKSDDDDGGYVQLMGTPNSVCVQ